jgi:cell division protein FtsL
LGTKESTEDLQEINKKNKSLIRRKNKRIKLLYGLIIVILVIFGGSAFFGMTKYNKLQQDNKRLSNPEESAKQEIEKLKSSVAALVDLPTGEEPTIATVTDLNKLKNQPFFTKAENGDKVLIYSKAKKAILYRPNTNKVIEFSTITSDTKSPDKQDGIKTTTTNESTAPSVDTTNSSTNTAP